MNFCFSKEMFDLPENLVVTGGVISRSSNLPKDFWAVGFPQTTRCIDTLCSIYDIDKPSLCTSVEEKTFKILGRSPNNIPWVRVLGLDECITRVLNISRRLELMFESTFDKRYVDIYVSSRRILEKLQSSTVDPIKLVEFMTSESNSSLKTCLKTFKPNRQCILERPIYSQCTTSTGRLTVSKGPSILTLPQRYRSIIKSRFEGGRILSIDFKSLEPRVALAVQDKKAPEDVYSYVSEKILEGSVDRKVSKLATIASLYGTSFRKFKEMSGCKDPQVLQVVKDFFGVKRLAKKVAVSNFVINFDRPLNNSTPDHRRISHFVQSTSCDIVNCSFGDFMQNFSSDKVVPVFLLHDALVVDVSPDTVQSVFEFTKRGLDTIMVKFPVTCENFS